MENYNESVAMSRFVPVNCSKIEHKAKTIASVKYTRVFDAFVRLIRRNVLYSFDVSLRFCNFLKFFLFMCSK